MARQLNLTTQKQEFLKQCYLKESLTRMHWLHRYGHSLSSVRNTKPKISKPKVEDCFKLPSISSAPSHGQVLKGTSEDMCKLGQTVNDSITKEEEKDDIMTNTAMRPVSSRTRNLLYSGTSKEEQGRYHYMKHRNKLKPEDKYNYPLITSWDYGWQMGNRTNDHGSFHRRCHIVSDTFFRKNGIPCDLSPTDMVL